VRSLPEEVQRELRRLVARYGAPLVRTFDVAGTVFDPLRKPDRYGEVCMVVRRSNGRLLTATKTFYPPGAYRLLTGGIRHGEGIWAALGRETREETGLDISVRRFLATLTYLRDEEPVFHTFAFLLDELGGELRVTDPAERHAGFREIEPAELPAIADNLARLEDRDDYAIGGRWRDWGRFRAAIHRAVWETLSESADTPALPRSALPHSGTGDRDAP
jgi:NAD+ diphosphatase